MTCVAVFFGNRDDSLERVFFRLGLLSSVPDLKLEWDTLCTTVWISGFGYPIKIDFDVWEAVTVC